MLKSDQSALQMRRELDYLFDEVSFAFSFFFLMYIHIYSCMCDNLSSHVTGRDIAVRSR